MGPGRVIMKVKGQDREGVRRRNRGIITAMATLDFTKEKIELFLNVIGFINIGISIAASRSNLVICFKWWKPYQAIL